MTSAVDRLLRADSAVHDDIDCNDDDVGFGVWKAVHAMPEFEIEKKHVLELATVRQCRNALGYQGYSVGKVKLPDTLGDESVPLPVVRLESCAGPNCRAKCSCWCLALEWLPPEPATTSSRMASW